MVINCLIFVCVLAGLTCDSPSISRYGEYRKDNKGEAPYKDADKENLHTRKLRSAKEKVVALT